MADYSFSHLTAATDMYSDDTARFTTGNNIRSGNSDFYMTVSNGGVPLGAFHLSHHSSTTNVFNSSQDRPPNGQLYPRFNK